MDKIQDDTSQDARRVAVAAATIEVALWAVIVVVSCLRTSTVYVGPAGDPDATDSLRWVQLDIAVALINTAISVGLLAVAIRWRGTWRKVALKLSGLTTLLVAMQVVVLSPVFRADKMVSANLWPVLLLTLTMLVVAIVKARRASRPAPSRDGSEAESRSGFGE